MPLTAIALNATLKSGKSLSSTDKMIATLEPCFGAHDVTISETIRLVDYNIKPGVTSDEGEGDDWPDIRERILAADILIFGTPVWMGQMSSVAKRVCERMDAFLSETDDKARMPSYSKVAIAAIVGNEDGAHAISADLFQALNDVGFTIPASGVCYWVGEAMGSVDYKDLKKTPDKVAETAKLVAANAAHLAKLMKEKPYPGS